jgi:hypothetical protein
MTTMQTDQGSRIETSWMQSMTGVYLCVNEYYGSSSFLSRLDNDAHTPLRAGAASTGNITSLQKAMHFPKAFMVDAIKSHLIKLLGTSSPGVNEEKY